MAQIVHEQLKVAAEKAVLVQVQLPGADLYAADPLGELRALAATAGAEVVGELIQRRQKPQGRTFLGKGRVEDLAHLMELTGAALVIFDNDLLPRHIRGLEERLHCKIVDRSELILDIFANRATTHAARLQVQIAQLEYTLPRLRALWDHLGQIVGGAPVGIGTRGPGEQQIEIDRRLARGRLVQLKRELSEIQTRKGREVAQRTFDHFTIGLVGYTNAGKSTVFNRLTTGGAFAHEKLFATLATRTERWVLHGGASVMLSDTVGFIRDLPHHLVASFRSTLEETVQAQLLLVVLDVADPAAEMQLRTVHRTLDEIGATEQPRLLLLNKIDRLQDNQALLVWLNRHPEAIPLCAHDGTGLDALAEAVFERLRGPLRRVQVEVPLAEARNIDVLEKQAQVLERNYSTNTVQLTVWIGRRQVEQLAVRGSRMTIDGRPIAEALAAWDRESTRSPGTAVAP